MYVSQMFPCRIILVLQTLFLLPCNLHRDLSTYLTLNKSKGWLYNQTEKTLTDNTYCSICCMDIEEDSVGKMCGKHTMCIYKDQPGPTCKGFISIRFTKEEITAIVDIHNTIRNWVAMGWEPRGDPGPQPRASNMRMVEWDAELALLANRWAAQCVFAHDLCRDLAEYPVGQNIAKGNYALNNDLSFVADWFDAVEMLDFKEISRYHLKKTKTIPSPSQYTQLVWAETNKIGCARVAFQRSDGSTLSYREHFICNYGPSGNIPGQSVYKVGEPCLECPTGTGCSAEYPGLCTGEVLHDVNLRIRNKKMKSHDTENSSEISNQTFLLPVLCFYWMFLIFY